MSRIGLQNGMDLLSRPGPTTLVHDTYRMETKGSDIGDLFAELIVFTGRKYPGWLTASVSSLVAEVQLSRVLTYLRENDALVSYFTGISQKMAHFSGTIEVLSLKTVRQRIAYTFLYGTMDDRGVRVSTSRLAGQINCSREAVSRGLTEMESDGLLERTPESLTILDRRRLEKLL